MKFIFTAGISWKVIQGKTKVTLQIFVISEEDDPLGPTPLDTYLLYYLLRGLSPCFRLLGRIIIKEWDFKPNVKAQVLAPTIAPHNSNFSLSSEEKKYNFDVPAITFKPTRMFKPRHVEGSFPSFHESL